jgi:hypothetical protein
MTEVTLASFLPVLENLSFMDLTIKDKYVHNPNINKGIDPLDITGWTQPQEADASTGKSQVYDYSDLPPVVPPPTTIPKQQVVIPDSPPSRKRYHDSVSSHETSSNDNDTPPTKKSKEATSSHSGKQQCRLTCTFWHGQVRYAHVGKHEA